MAAFDPRPAPITPASAWLVGAALASAIMLAVAHGFERFAHLPPCELCLHQREGYWAALWLALAGVVAWRLRPGTSQAMATLLGLVFLLESGLAAYHAGVEWKWWPGPTSCTGNHVTVTADQMKTLLSGVTFNMVRCDQAAWRWLGLSMAGWNAIGALGLAAASFASVAMTRATASRRLAA